MEEEKKRIKMEKIRRKKKIEELDEGWMYMFIALLRSPSKLGVLKGSDTAIRAS